MTHRVEGVGERFLLAISTGAFPALAACLSDDARFRALVPRGLREATGPKETARYFQTWFGSADRIEALSTSAESMLGGRHHLAWRLQVDESGQRSIVEQQAFATLVDDRITQLDLVCSGFLQAGSPEHADVAAVLDGGEQGCATLTPLIKARLSELASQQVLEIVTREPSAAADIESWCTLTGNVLVETRPEGDIQRTYVRKK
ncbi:MAG: sulfurtransferase TusA family protein [Chloroflexota bacterium]|nr:sulfurtransferase TusA family protein [Chloroflexota bacterium]